MPNYSLKFGVSEVAKLFEVETNVVKTWARTFKDYLSGGANPEKGLSRQFCMEDIRVFSYVSFYWENNPDLYCIKCGLNSNDHFEEIIDDFVKSLTPLFSEIPDDVEERANRSIVFEGFSEFGDIHSLAYSYKKAGDILLDNALKTGEKYELIGPIIFNYRHAIELFLKSAITVQKFSHDLSLLFEEFRTVVKDEFRASVPAWLDGVIQSLNDLDVNSTTFRYGGSLPQSELFVDLRHFKYLIDQAVQLFEKLHDRRKFAIEA